MINAIALLFFALSAVGLVFTAVQHLALRSHLKRPATKVKHRPGMSILKPLCGADDHLLTNLSTFAHLDYPSYEIVLGVRDKRDAAYAVALQARALWPELVRVVLQRGAPGLNPKVNQLITLAAAARHDVLVVSDSNVLVPPDYLDQIAADLEDSRVGLVTHPLAGIGEKRLGAFFDNAYLSAGITPGVIAAKNIGGTDFVVAKSLAIRRVDLEALGGFDALKDVLAEDFVIGRLVSQRLGKRVALAHRPVFNVSSFRSVSSFVARYARWSVLQRKAVGPVVYALELLLNPAVLASLAFAADVGWLALSVWSICCSVKAFLDCASARVLRGSGMALRYLPMLLVKDLLVGLAWSYGLVSNKVNWRGTPLRVLEGTRLARVADASRQLEAAPAPLTGPG